MGVVDDIIDRLEEILDELGDTIVENVIGTLAKILISGITVVGSTPGLLLASVFNNRIGYIDPLLLSPIQCYPSFLQWDTHIDTVECFNSDLMFIGGQGILCSVVDSRNDTTMIDMLGTECVIQEANYIA